MKHVTYCLSTREASYMYIPSLILTSNIV